jgi:hypothetical protein
MVSSWSTPVSQNKSEFCLNVCVASPFQGCSSFEWNRAVLFCFNLAINFFLFSIKSLFGIGAYFESSFNNFIEYGAGFCYMPSKFGYFVQYSNWARTNYVSVGITKVF